MKVQKKLSKRSKTTYKQNNAKGKWQKHLKVIKETLGMDKEDELILFSSETGQGKDEVWGMLQKRMK